MFGGGFSVSCGSWATQPEGAPADFEAHQKPDKNSMAHGIWQNEFFCQINLVSIQKVKENKKELSNVKEGKG